MVNRLLIFLSAAALVVACRSGSKEKPAASAEGEMPLAEATLDTGEEAAAQDETAPGGSASFGRGENRVFGIKIPTGMVPAPGPKKVYRFRGNREAGRIAGLIRDQISAREEVKEGDGYLFRFATAREAAGNEGDPDLGVRVFPSSGGAVLDIWLEKTYATALPKRDGPLYLPKPTAESIHRRTVRKSDRKGSVKDRAAAMRVLQKIERGEPLTPEDAATGMLD